jgi:transcriptional regulator with XRE-family HTH domain
VNDLRSIRKTRGMTMEQLASASGVSSKTISLYEHTPPKRPSRKVVDKLSQALDISSDVLLGSIGSKAKPLQAVPLECPEETIELEDFQVARIMVLVEKELQGLHQMVIESASLAEDYPVVARSIEYLSHDIDLLNEIRQKLSHA